jgi:hypothetical protein
MRSTPGAVAPPPITLSSPHIINGQFSFNYNVSPGSSYLVLSSSNLVNWVAVSTNTPAASPATFSAAVVSKAKKFYRVMRLQ